MKRNIGKFAANIAAAGMLLGAAAVWADDQQGQQSSSSQNPSQQQSGQAATSSSSTSSDQSGKAGQSGQDIKESAGAETPGEKLDAAMKQAASDPQQFIKAAHQYSLFEVKAGQLAQQKAQDQKTKDFAQTLVQDHQPALDQLKKLADSKNIQLSDQLSAPRQRMLDELSNLSGADFDKAFMNQQVRGHRRELALYKDASEKNTDAEVKQFAQQGIAGLEHHLQMAQQSGSISEPAGAQGKQGEQGSSSSSSSSQDQSSQPGQSAQPQSAQPDQSGQSAQPK
jgi:putative membrane protein